MQVYQGCIKKERGNVKKITSGIKIHLRNNCNSFSRIRNKKKYSL